MRLRKLLKVIIINRGNVMASEILEDNNKKSIPIISITTMDEDDIQTMRKLILTQREISILKLIYENVMLKKCPDIFIDSNSYKNLMNKNLVMFSQTYRNVVLTNISEAIIKSKKESGKVEMGEVMVVEWKGF